MNVFITSPALRIFCMLDIIPGMSSSPTIKGRYCAEQIHFKLLEIQCIILCCHIILFNIQCFFFKKKTPKNTTFSLLNSSVVFKDKLN